MTNTTNQTPGAPAPGVTLQDLAREVSAWFETATRTDGPDFTRLRNGRPEWVRDLVYEAHGGDFGMMPDDWRYDCIASAVAWIADIENDPEDGHEFADQHVSIYTSNVLAWLASNTSRVGYVDDAAAEYGTAGEHGFDVVRTIQRGQYAEALEVYNLVIESLRKRADADGES